jgi:hypothetical protein
MPPLSATDAISPAWQHTRRLLLGPRDPRLFFKIAAVAFFAEMLSGSFSFSRPFHSPHTAGGGVSPAFNAAILGIIPVAVVVGLLVGLVFFYLSSRLHDGSAPHRAAGAHPAGAHPAVALATDMDARHVRAAIRLSTS